MNTGQIISAAGHLALLGLAVFGGAFQADPLPFEVTEVSTISTAEYEALFDAADNPDAVANVDTPEPPEAGQAPEVASVTDTAPENTQPDPTEAASPDETPQVIPDAPAETEVEDTAPVLQPPPEDVAALAPEVNQNPVPEAAPRIAPEAVAEPEPDVQIDDVDRNQSSPDENAAEVVEEQEQTAREEASDRTVTEADEAAPSRSLRPKLRPTRPTATQQAESEPSQSATDDAVNAALAEALAGSDDSSDAVPSGPPLTSGEKDALRVAVQRCWNVGSLSTDALSTTVVVGFSMSEDGKPITGSIKMLGSSGGSGAAAGQAFEAARRAIIRCGGQGFPLPADKFSQWRDIEITFNPENMRIR